MTWPRAARRAVLGLVVAFLLTGGPLRAALPGARIRLADSVKEIPAGSPTRIRDKLTAAELAAPLDLVVSLRMRDLPGLQALVQAGKTVTRAELEATYLPSRSDYERVAAWLRQEGLSLNAADPFRLNLVLRGTVAQVAAAFDVPFSRVATSEGEFSSAVAAPSVPQDLAGVVLGVVGLQPHIRMRSPMRKQAGLTNVAGQVTPADVVAAYDAPAGLDGSGQTIAVIMAATVQASDLATFWQLTGSSDTAANFIQVLVNGGPTADSQATNADEAALDVEWASGIAPGAQVRLYAVPDLTLNSVLSACLQVVADGSSTIVTYSAAGPESDNPDSTLTACSQAFLAMAASGFTFFAASGDSGSNPYPSASGIDGYGSSNPLGVNYPASDPNVTAVGGTTMTLDQNWVDQGEIAWSQLDAAQPAASGGGVSAVFARPVWQAGAGVPAGTMRCVPDISAMASVNPLAGDSNGAVVVLNGATEGLVGTSLASPIMAGLAALIKESRASQGLPNFGLLGPKIYPLIGSTALYDVTSGTNGAFQATAGYDLCTGVGTPDIARMIDAFSAVVTFNRPPPGPIGAGTVPVSMSVDSGGAGTYQWQLDGVDIPGATHGDYVLVVPGTADAGDYSVAVTTTQGTITYDVGTLSIVSDARIINLSARAQVQTGSSILIAGFVVAGTGGKSMLLRGIGPALSQFGLSTYLASPVLTLFDSAGTALATNSAWGGGANLAAAMSAVGAFALPPASLDDVLLKSIPPGAYTAQVAGSAGATGVALAELYDDDGAAPSARLINISARADIQSGSNILIAGFVVAGGPSGADETVLIRGIGPALTVLGVPGALANPALTLLDSSGNAIATNQGWNSASSIGSSPTLANVEISTPATLSKVGAFALASGSADAAMTVTLPPGSYTAQVSGANGATGVGLVEVYEVK
jgi:kumamolisin